MSLLAPTRRGFLAGMASLLAAPAIVRASSLMQIVVPSQWVEPGLYSLEFSTDDLLVKGTERFSYGYWDIRAAGAYLTAFDPDGHHEMLITERIKLPTRTVALAGTKMPAVCALDVDTPLMRDYLDASPDTWGWTTKISP